MLTVLSICQNCLASLVRMSVKCDILIVYFYKFFKLAKSENGGHHFEGISKARHVAGTSDFCSPKLQYDRPGRPVVVINEKRRKSSP